MDFEGKTKEQVDAEAEKESTGVERTPEVTPMNVVPETPVEGLPTVSLPERQASPPPFESSIEEESAAMADDAKKNMAAHGDMGDMARAFLYRFNNDATLSGSDHAVAAVMSLYWPDKDREQHLADIRESGQKLVSENPWSAGAGSLAGGAAQAAFVGPLTKMLPGLPSGLANASAGVKAYLAANAPRLSKIFGVGAQIAKSAAVGAGSLGAQEAVESVGTDQDAYDAFINGAAWGGGMGAAAPASMMAISKIYSYADPLVRKTFQVFLGPNAEELANYAKRRVQDPKTGKMVYAADLVDENSMSELVSASDAVLKRANADFLGNKITLEEKKSAYKAVSDAVKDQSVRLKNKLQDMRPDPDMAEKIHDSIKSFRDKSWQLRQEAAEILEKSGGMMSSKELVDEIANIQASIRGAGGVASEQGVQTIKALDRISGEISDLYTKKKTGFVKGYPINELEYVDITPTQYESLLQNISKSIDPSAWSGDAMKINVGWKKAEGATALKRLRSSMRGKIKDLDIKGYEDRMKMVSDMLTMQDDLRTVFPRSSDFSAVDRAVMGLVKSQDQKKIDILQSYAKNFGGVDVIQEMSNLKNARDILRDPEMVGRFHEAANDMSKAQAKLLKISQVLPQDDPEIAQMGMMLKELAMGQSAVDEAADTAVRYVEEMSPLYSGTNDKKGIWQESTESGDKLISNKIASGGKLSRPSESNIAVMNALDRYQKKNPISGEVSIDDLASRAKDVQMDKYLRGKFPAGSARTNLFAALGIGAASAGLGAVESMALLAPLGLVVDNYGGSVARNMYKVYLKLKIDRFNAMSALPLGLSMAAGRAGMRIKNDSPEYSGIMKDIVENKSLDADKKLRALKEFKDGIDVGTMFGE